MSAERRLLEEVYSGREIHHDQGGRVVVITTDGELAEAVREHVASYGVTDAEIRLVAHSKDPLDVTAEELQQRLGNGRDSEDDRHVAVSRGSLGKVTVEFVDGPMNDTERDVLAEPLPRWTRCRGRSLGLKGNRVQGVGAGEVAPLLRPDRCGHHAGTRSLV